MRVSGSFGLGTVGTRQTGCKQVSLPGSFLPNLGRRLMVSQEMSVSALMTEVEYPSGWNTVGVFSGSHENTENTSRRRREYLEPARVCSHLVRELLV